MHKLTLQIVPLCILQLIWLTSPLAFQNHSFKGKVWILYLFSG